MLFRQIKSSTVRVVAFGANLNQHKAYMINCGTCNYCCGECFRVSVSRSDLVSVVGGVLSRQQIERSLVFWNKRIVREGEEIRAGLQVFSMPFDGAVVFVDLAPQANWAHPCVFILVSCKTLEAKTVESSFPPLMDKIGESWAVLLRFGKKPADENDFSAFSKNEQSNENINLDTGGEKT
jgi:hypothetical protein